MDEVLRSRTQRRLKEEKETKEKNFFKIFTDNPIVKEAAKVVKNVSSETNKIVNNLVKETKEVVKNAAKETERTIANVAKGTKEVVNNVAKETEKTVTNVAKGTKETVKNVTKETKRVIISTASEAKKIMENIEKEVDEMILNSAEKADKNLDDLDKIVSKSKISGLNLSSNIRDLRMLNNESKIRIVSKELDKLEKKQKNKTFEEMISKMKLGKGTISNRVEMADGSTISSIYNNFGKEKLRIGEEISFGKDDDNKMERFKILKISEDKKTRTKAVVVGNIETGEVEIIFEGSMPPTGILKDPEKVIKHWYNNVGGNLRRPLFDLLGGAVTPGSSSLKNGYESNENGTPLDYQVALKFAKEIQEEYKNGKDGFKGLSRVSGHSKAGGQAIYIASHLDIEAIAVDPAPVVNPGKYLYNDKILALVPGEGNALLNGTKENSKGAITLKPKISNLTQFLGIGEVGRAFWQDSRMSNIAAMRVKAKEDTYSHTADIEGVKTKEDEVINDLKRYKENGNRGR